MEKRTEGAWIIHHTKKIQEVNSATEFEDIELAGKCGLLLSGLAASDNESTIEKDKVSAIAKAAGVKKVELGTIQDALKEFKLIDVSKNGSVSVLGITSSNILTHTSELFNEINPTGIQKAALELANKSSDNPISEKILKEDISDTFKIDKANTDLLFKHSEEIGIVDFEKIDSEKLYFNGNLFKKDTINKTSKVFASLSTEDVKHVKEVNEILDKEGCILQDQAIKILGEKLLAKLKAIALYDFNEVSNVSHTMVFLTKPSAFCKFGNPFEDDALDLAKAFIASLMYGMKVSSRGRGKIVDYRMLGNTVRKLLRGELVGPCTAIGQDYQVLELKRVIELVNYGSGMYYMKLLKFDIGRIALDVLEKGDIADKTTLNANIDSSSVSNYSGPEQSRIRARKDTTKIQNISDLLRTMRT